MTIRTWACVRGGANHARPSRGRRRSWTLTLVVHLILTGLAVLTLSPVVPAEAAGPWQGQVLDAETRGPIELALSLVLAMGAALVALEHWFPAHPIRPDVRWYVRASKGNNSTAKSRQTQPCEKRLGVINPTAIEMPTAKTPASATNARPGRVAGQRPPMT